MRFAICLVLFALIGAGWASESVRIQSPDGRVSAMLSVGDRLEWSVSRDGRDVVCPSRLGLEFVGMPTFGSLRIVERRQRSADATWETRIYRKGTVHDRYNELKVTLEEDSKPASAGASRRLGLVFRAYDEGVAFRYVVPEQESFYGFELLKDLTEWRFAGNPQAWVTEYGTHLTSQEQPFVRKSLGSVPSASLVGMPLLVETDGRMAALCEADLTNWAGMFYRVRGMEGDETVVGAELSPLPPTSAATKGVAVIRMTPARSPWRVVICGDDEVDLLKKNDIIVNLNPPPDPTLDFSWVVPGATGWDWWVESNNSLSTELTLRLVDFAAEMGWPYHTIDGGWYGFARRPNHGPDVRLVPRRGFDLDRIIAHAKSKGVGIWVWAYWQAVEDNGVEETFADFERRGIKGVKIDFLDRQDQWMVNWYAKTIRIAAKHHLMINYHGAFKPTGMERTWPNNLTREGIRGNENSKWSKGIDAVHAATLPFTRFLLGPGDYTPGSFANFHAADFVPQNQRGHRYGDESDRRRIWAGEIGTRAHAIALCIAYDSYLTTLCDWPERYRGAPGAEALRNLPTVWKSTEPVSGKIGEHYAVVRETHDGRFYFAALTVAARDIDLDLGFLGEGAWRMDAYADDPDRTPGDAAALSVSGRDVRRGETVRFGLCAEGGAVAVFSRVR